MEHQENNIKPGKKTEKKNILYRLMNSRNSAKKEEKRKAKEIDMELKNIYRDSKGQMPNLTKLDFVAKNGKRNLIIALISFLLIIFTVTFLGFWIFNPAPKFSNDGVKFEIKAPFNVNSGEKINYQIKFFNNEGVSLSNTKLTVNLPAGFSFINSNIPPLNAEKENSAVKEWQINDLFIGQSQIIDINGIIIGSVNSKAVLTATLSYTPANFNSQFQKKITFTTEIMDSLLSLNTERISQVANEELNEIKVKIANKSKDVPLSNILVDLNFPEQYSLLEIIQLNIGESAPKADPAALNKAKSKTSPHEISLASLLPQEEKTIIFRGKFSVPETKNIDLNLQIKIKNLNEEYIMQEEEKMSFEVIKGELLTNLIIQGSNQNKPINPGDTLNYLLSVQNKGVKTLGDIKIRIVLSSLFIDWKSINDKNGGIQQDNQILWTSQQIPILANLLPEEEVEIPLQIKLQNLKDINNYKPEDLMVKSFFETQVNKINNAAAELTNQSNTIVNEFNTDLSLISEARYFGSNSETLGSGPLPPIVGQKTTYKISWKLNNSLHEISNIVVKSKLPDYIAYEGGENLSTGNILKNQNNEVVWQIARIPASINQATAEFYISLTPQSEDVGKILSLSQECLLTATDSKTAGQIVITLPGQTTNLDSDPLGKGKGLIEAE